MNLRRDLPLSASDVRRHLGGMTPAAVVGVYLSVLGASCAVGLGVGALAGLAVRHG